MTASEEFRRAASTATVLVTVSLLTELRCTIGLSKSVLIPCKGLEYLGFIVDTAKQAFIILPRKIASFVALRE